MWTSTPDEEATVQIIKMRLQMRLHDETTVQTSGLQHLQNKQWEEVAMPNTNWEQQEQIQQCRLQHCGSAPIYRNKRYIQLKVSHQKRIAAYLRSLYTWIEPLSRVNYHYTIIIHHLYLDVLVQKMYITRSGCEFPLIVWIHLTVNASPTFHSGLVVCKN